MGYIVRIDVEVIDFRDENGEWLDGDYREIEPLTSTDLFVDPKDIQEVGLASATVRLIPPGEFELSAGTYPLTADNASESVWLTDSYTNPYTGQVTETTVWLSGDYTGEERAVIMNAVCVI